MNILFITTHNLATNPRIFKEINLALSEGYKVGVVLFHFSNWSDAINEKLLNQIKDKVEIFIIPAGRKPLLPWIYSTILNKLAGVCSKFFSLNERLLSVYCEKRSYLLATFLSKLKVKPECIIAHNIGSFYPAYKFSNSNNIPFAIDIEDYHAGESANITKASSIKKLCNLIFPKASYLSAASPLILDYSLKDINADFDKPAFVINNFFPASEFIPPKDKLHIKLRCVWFSQNINAGRGLEFLIPVIKELNEKIELHLYGNLNKDFYDSFIKDADNIFIHPPLPQPDLHKALALYDVGLAIEPGKDLNNSLAVSNKINAYLQSGLYVIVSNTLAQKKWINEFTSFGILIDLNNKPELAETFLNCFNKLSEIREMGHERFEFAKSYCWEEESKKLKKIWLNLVNKNDIKVENRKFESA